MRRTTFTITDTSFTSTGTTLTTTEAGVTSTRTTFTTTETSVTSTGTPFTTTDTSFTSTGTTFMTTETSVTSTRTTFTMQEVVPDEQVRLNKACHAMTIFERKLEWMGNFMGLHRRFLNGRPVLEQEDTTAEDEVQNVVEADGEVCRKPRT